MDTLKHEKSMKKIAKSLGSSVERVGSENEKKAKNRTDSVLVFSF